MIRPQFYLYEDIEQKIEDRQKFSLIIINAIDAPKHAHISGQVEFTSMMHYLSLWALAAGKKLCLENGLMLTSSVKREWRYYAKGIRTLLYKKF
ncbi:hypothetical protein [Photobacterium kishitanii]|uniref:hypothetical protein n=1 Tax=Photobacterium kishitanii TaxID=318456 RepID=UPI0027397508|nr:hypothetical protein [Photobacterium kishitanii]